MIVTEARPWKRVALVALVALGAATVGTARAADAVMSPGPYVGLGAGATQQNNTSLNNLSAGGFVPGSAHFDTGWNIIGSAGYKWNNGLRAEMEVGHRQADVASLNGLPVHGDTYTDSVMGNLLYDFDTHAKITPYVGGGLGVGYQEWNHVHDITFSNAARLSDSGLQWQLIGGVAIPVDRRFSVFAEYRYIGLDDLHFAPAFFANTTAIGHYNDRSSNILVGFRWSLGSGTEVNSRQLY